MSKLRVALISFHSFFQPGGVKRHIFGLAKEFKKKGIYTRIIVPRRKKEEDYGKDVLLLGTSFPVNFSGSQSDFDVNFNPLAIEKVLKKEKFDILHFHNFGFPSSVQILERSGALNILTFHADIRGSKFLTKIHFLWFLNKVLDWKIDGIIGVAPLISRFFKNYSKPKIVIPNGIDLERFRPKGEKIKKFLDNKINILFLGRIEKRKGLIYLLQAYRILDKKFPNLRLIIVGNGPLKSELEQWVKQNKLKNVVFEGLVKEEKIPGYYRSCDIFVSPAIFGESFGLVLLEAMACAKPIAAFSNQGYKEFLKGKSAAEFLVKPKDYKNLAKKLEILIENKALREKMGRENLKHAREYSWEKIAERVLDFYEFCQKEKQKRKSQKGFSLEEYFNKVLNKKLPKMPKFF